MLKNCCLDYCRLLSKCLSRSLQCLHATLVLQLKQHLLELRQTQESLQEQTQLCNAQEEEMVGMQAEYAPDPSHSCASVHVAVIGKELAH